MSRTIAVDDSIFCVSYIQSYPWITVDNDNMVGLELQFRKIKLGLIYLITWPINERWNTSHPRKFNTSHHQSFRRLQYVEKHCVGVKSIEPISKILPTLQISHNQRKYNQHLPLPYQYKICGMIYSRSEIQSPFRNGHKLIFLMKVEVFWYSEMKKGLFNIPQSGHESV